MSGSSFAASADNSGQAYAGPGGSAPIGVGVATYHFLKMPLNFPVWEFIGIAFLLLVVSRRWGKFVNEL